MTKAEEYIIRSIVSGFDQAEYVSKADALRAVKIEHEEMIRKFNSIFHGGNRAEVSMCFEPDEGAQLKINIITRG